MNAKGIATYRILVPMLLGVVAVVVAIYAGDRVWDNQPFGFRPLTSHFQMLELFGAALMMTAANGLGLRRGKNTVRLAAMGALTLGIAMAILQTSSLLAGAPTYAAFEEALREVANFAIGGLFSGVVAGVVAQTMQHDDLVPLVPPLRGNQEVVAVPVAEDLHLRN